MKIQYVEIDGLNGSKEFIRLDFNNDLNIITGRNGAGKTTILKLIWYIVSGNISFAIREINFRKIKLQTTDYSCIISRTTRNNCSLYLKVNEQDPIEIDDWVIDEEDEDEALEFLVTQLKNIADKKDIQQQNPNSILSKHGGSLFLPTFRRIEGGVQAKRKNIRAGMSSSRRLEVSLMELSDMLTNRNHQFVASLGTIDIERFLRDKNAELVEEVTTLQNLSNLNMSEKLKELQKETNTEKVQEELKKIHTMMAKSEQRRVDIMKPLEVARQYILDILKISGIKIGNLTFGSAVETINSNLLSAGEKQMLSFLAYNAFYQDTIFIIDEPELSLHVDWQRILFPTLMRQNSSNQFIIATHSPFIYNKYPDKELVLSSDKGDGCLQND